MKTYGAMKKKRIECDYFGKHYLKLCRKREKSHIEQELYNFNFIPIQHSMYIIQIYIHISVR